MAAFTWDPETWATENFATCQLKNKARNRRLIQITRQVLRRSDSSIPDQTEFWADAQGAYRFFDTDDISYQDIIAPHCESTRRSCQPETYKFVCDRGADDIEVMHRAKWQGCGFVIRASRLQRKVVTEDGRMLPLDEVLKEWPASEQHVPFRCRPQESHPRGSRM